MSDEPKRQSRAWILWATFAGLPFLYVLASGVMFFFVLGVCVSEAIVETFWPQWENVIGIRFAGGIAALVVLAFAFKLAWGQWARRHRVRFTLLGIALGSALAWLIRYWIPLLFFLWNPPGE
jgi:hypothetical protein